MSDLIIEAGSLEEAIEKTETKLGIKRDEFNIEIVEEKEKGIFGFKWGKKVCIKVFPKGKNIVEPLEILKKMMELSGIDGKINVVDTFDEILLDVQMESDTESLFIGKYGKNLDAYQYLVNKIYEKRFKDNGKRLVIDCADYRKRKKIKLESIAKSAARKVKQEGRKYTFYPMQSDERRVIHMMMKEEGLITESKGTGKARSVVVYPPDISMQKQ